MSTALYVLLHWHDHIDCLPHSDSKAFDRLLKHIKPVCVITIAFSTFSQTKLYIISLFVLTAHACNCLK